MEHDNENEPLTFKTLAAVTARVLRLDQGKNETRDTTDDGKRSEENEKQKEAQRQYVDRRLSDLRTFEKLVSGAIKRRR